MTPSPDMPASGMSAEPVSELERLKAERKEMNRLAIEAFVATELNYSAMQSRMDSLTQELAAAEAHLTTLRSLVAQAAEAIRAVLTARDKPAFDAARETLTRLNEALKP